MTFETYAILTLLCLMVYLFVSGKLPVDLVACFGLLVLTLFGLLSPREALSGFSSPVTITTVSMFFLSAALYETGVSDFLARFIHRVAGKNEVASVAILMLTTAVASAFLSTLSATALLLPSAVALAEKTSIPSTRLLMPVAFASLLGGMTTLIGSTANLVAFQALNERGLTGLKFTNFGSVGLICVFSGVALFAFFGKRLLPSSRAGRGGGRHVDPIKVYRLAERLFSLRVPYGSHLHGMALEKSQLGRVLGLTVVSIQRGLSRQLSPDAHTELKVGDSLAVRGRLSDLEELRHFRGATITPLSEPFVTQVINGLSGAKIELSPGSHSGTTFTAGTLLEQFGIRLIALERSGLVQNYRVSDELLRGGDILHVLGPSMQIASLSEKSYFKIIETKGCREVLKNEGLFSVQLSLSSGCIGKSFVDLGFTGLETVVLLGALRQGKIIFAGQLEQKLQAGDQLIFAADKDRMENLTALADLELEAENTDSNLESEDVGLVEVVLSPRSELVGSTLEEVDFRERFDFQVLALWRDGQPIRSHISRFPLRFGDALLLQGPRRKMAKLARTQEFLLLNESIRTERRRSRAVWAIVSMFVAVGMSVWGLQPIEISAFCGAVMALLSGAIRTDEAYRAIDWKLVVYVAALIPFGLVIERSGVSGNVAGVLLEITKHIGPYSALILLMVVSSIISQFLDKNIAVIVLAPVAIQSAALMGVSPYPLVLAATFGSALAFLTPVSARSNLLVTGAGGYQSRDFLLPGSLLSLLLLAVLTLVIPWVFPF